MSPCPAEHVARWVNLLWFAGLFQVGSCNATLLSSMTTGCRVPPFLESSLWQKWSAPEPGISLECLSISGTKDIYDIRHSQLWVKIQQLTPIFETKSRIPFYADGKWCLFLSSFWWLLQNKSTGMSCCFVHCQSARCPTKNDKVLAG